MYPQKDLPLIGLIASKNPVSALEATVNSLFKGGASRVVVVDDGSDDPDSAAVFNNVEKIGAEVIHLKINVGKAKALRAGFLIFPEACIVVQTDDDTLAGKLSGPAQLIKDGKADIVDIRVETTRTHSLLGLMQELDYWMINAIPKRLQDYFSARLWMSGASVMYSYEAGKVIILERAHSITEGHRSPLSGSFERLSGQILLETCRAVYYYGAGRFSNPAQAMASLGNW